MSAKNIPIQFNLTTSTEHGDGVLIHWTTQPVKSRRAIVLCASVESTRTVKRMTKYLREEGRP